MSKFLEVKQSPESFNLEELQDYMDPIVGIHPELVMDDNAIIIFPDQKSYYDFISNADLFSNTDNEINIEALMENYDCDCIVPEEYISFEGSDINLIFIIDFNSTKICYIIRDGENKMLNVLGIL